jgi:urease accessory protein
MSIDHPGPSGPALYRLFAWLSPAFPIGAFSYSHGLEYAVEAGMIADRAGLAEWVESLILHGAGQADAVLLARAFEAACIPDRAEFAGIAELAAALQPTAEIAHETTAQGTAFLAAVRAAWPEPGLASWVDAWPGPWTLPVAVAAAAAAGAPDARPPLPALLAAYLQAYAGNAVSAGVRLIPLGQTDGQIVVAGMERVTAAAAACALATPLDRLGTSTPMVDWASMRHETQYTRLFRS